MAFLSGGTAKQTGNLKILYLSLTVVIALSLYYFLPESCSEAARRTAFIFVMAGAFWALEIVPIYATSLGVVLLLTFLLGRPHDVLPLDATGYEMFLVPFSSPVIMLFFGGFVLAAAVHKYEVDRFFAVRLLKWFGQRPFFILCGFMATTAFLSMWLSNTATAALMMAMIVPFIRAVDETDPFRISLGLCIPFAANLGGIATPVGTPPNAIAIGILADHGIVVSFLSWMAMALPLAVVLLIFAAFLLFTMYPAKQKKISLEVTTKSHLSLQGKATILIALATVALWLSSSWHHIPEAMVALLAVGLLAMFGLITREEFQHIEWDILVLMWGGLALGKGMQVSGLADWVIKLPLFPEGGFLLVVVFALLAVLFSTFISNTATANLVIPLAMSIPGENPIILAVITALCCSFAMALPISTPPNAIAFSANAFTARQMAVAGVTVSLSSLLLVLIGFKFILPKVFAL